MPSFSASLSIKDMFSSTLSICILFLLLLYRYFVYPACLCPLSRLPNAHFTCRYSSGWILWQRYRGTENRAIHTAHERFGPIVRVGPKDITVNCVDGGIKTIYGGAFEKHEWYLHVFKNYGYEQLFLHSDVALLKGFQNAEYVLNGQQQTARSPEAYTCELI